MSSSDQKLEQLSQDETEEAVMAALPMLDTAQLETLYGLIGLELKPVVEGNKRALLKGLRRHLDEIDDVGSAEWQHYVQILNHLNTKEGKKKVVGAVAKEEGSGGSNDATSVVEATDDRKTMSSSSNNERSSSTNNMNSFVRFRDYKFNGTIGGEKGLSFMSIQFEIQNARSLKYKEEEIRAAVIRAIAPGHELREYFELNTDETLDDMIETFHSTFVEHDSDQSLTLFKKEAQKPNEPPSKFVTRVAAWRRKLKKLSIEEGDEIPDRTLMKAFHHVLSTGIRDEYLRAELREQFRLKPSMTDNDILRAIAEIMKVKKEREEKLSLDDTKDNVVQVGAVDTQKKSEKKEKMNPFALIEEMKSSHQRQMDQMRQDVTVQLARIEKTLSSGSGLNGNAPSFQPTSQHTPSAFPSTSQHTAPVFPTTSQYTAPSSFQPTSASQATTPAPFTYQHFKTSYIGFPEHVIQQHWNNFLQNHFPQVHYQQPAFNNQPNSAAPYPQSAYQQMLPQNVGSNNRKRGSKCNNCHAANIPHCKHCLKCLKEGHKISACQEKCQNCVANNTAKCKHCLKCLLEGHLLSACPEN